MLTFVAAKKSRAAGKFVALVVAIGSLVVAIGSLVAVNGSPVVARPLKQLQKQVS